MTEPPGSSDRSGRVIRSPASEASSAARRVWKVKHAVRRTLLNGLEKSGLYRAVGRMRGDYATILCYRAVGCVDLPLDPSNIVPVEEFRRQMQFVADHKHAVSLDHCLDHVDRHGSPPPNSVVITFDDGFACCREVVAPILSEFGLKATFFVIPGFTEDPRPKWDDFLRAVCNPFNKGIIRQPKSVLLDELECVRRAADPQRVAAVTRALCDGMLTFQQMRELVEMGFSVQSHGYHHWYLSSQPPDVHEREVYESKQVLEERVGAEVRHFSVPFGYPGSFNDDTVRMLRDAGYASSFGGHIGYLTARSDRFAMPRFAIHNGVSFDRYRLIVSGGFV